jgi:biopolymer transport protein ExbD
MAFSGSKRGVKNDINVTPLVDVVLVLLIIFMVVTPMLQRGREVHLPKVKTSDESKKPDALIISVLPDHSVWVESTRVKTEQLREALTTSVREHPDRKLLIKGDEALQVRDVRAVIAVANQAGAKGVSLAVEEVKR